MLEFLSSAFMPKAEVSPAQVEQLEAFFRLGKINPSNSKRT
jgi:hypothetical protein